MQGLKVQWRDSWIVSLMAVTCFLAATWLGVGRKDSSLGTVLLVLGFATVIALTAYLAVMTERRQQAAQLQGITETSPCIFLIIRQGQILHANSAAALVTEYPVSDLVGMPLDRLLEPADRDRLLGWYQQSDLTKGWRSELQIRTRSGQQRWLDFTAGMIRLNGEKAMLTTAYDITKRKQAEQEVALATDRERLLAEISLRIGRSLQLDEILHTTVEETRHFLKVDRVIISRINPDGVVDAVAESVDPQWPSVLGLRSDVTGAAEVKHLMSQGIRVVNDNAQIPQKTPFLAEYYRIGQVQAGMGVALMQEGQMFGALIVSQCSQPRQWQPWEIDLLQRLATQVEIALQQGHLYEQVRNLATNLEQQVQDRTIELQQRNQELQHLNQELQHLNQSKDLLLHAVTHDLRTPVQGMLMVLNQLCRASQDVVTVPQSTIARMIASSDRQLTLLNLLIQEQTLGHQEIPMHCQPLQLPRILTTAIDHVQELFERNQTVLVNLVAETVPIIYGDAQQIQQVLEELFVNAVQHNPPARTVTITAHGVGSDNENNLSLKVTITDDGVGLTSTQQTRLFQLYVRAWDNCHRTGIGLGLYQCQQIVQQHGGQIGVTSQVGQGSQFWFTLPLALTNWERLPRDV